MTEQDALKIAVYVLQHSDEDRLTAGEIVDRALNRDLRPLWASHSIDLLWSNSSDKTAIAASLSKTLRRHVESKRPTTRVIDGSRTGWRVGPRAASLLIDVTPTLQVTSSSHYIGLSGEYAVMSELLALDWNVAKPPLDNGVDLFATKNGEVRTVQVKTAVLKNLVDGRLLFSGSRRSHRLYDTISHYYVLVFRLIAGTRWKNTFYVIRSSDFDRLISTAAEVDMLNDKWTLAIHRQGDRFLVGGIGDITDDLDQLEKRFL